jgi:AcrR family transcriptional regulator
MKQGQLGKLTPREEKTQRRITSHARQVFIERGFRRVTVEQLCTGAAVSKRTFYKYFAGRDELVEVVLFEAISPHIEGMYANLTSDRPVPEVLRQHFDSLRDGIFTSVSQPFMVDIQTLQPALWDRIEQLRTVMISHMAELFARGKREGSINPNIDPEKFSRILQRIFVTVATPQAATEMDMTLAELATGLRAMVFEGLLVAPERKE